MSVPHPIPYQGSKRQLARAILQFVPERVERIVEPFAGSAAISLAAAKLGITRQFLLNDINEPLMALWREICERPTLLADAYAELWHQQLGREREYYDIVRAEFNRDHGPSRFLYLLARCVKASVRYNAYGQFNQSPDNRRRGAHPDTMRTHIMAAGRLLHGRATFESRDYRDVLGESKPGDLLYMDPPYQGVSGGRDQRYAGQVDYEDFVAALRSLIERKINFVVSYDGRCGDRQYGRGLPGDLGLAQIEIDAGRSTQATLLGRRHETVESLYLSPQLIEIAPISRRIARRAPQQQLLFGLSP